MSDHARFRNRFAVLILPVLFLVEFDLHGQAAPPAASAAAPPSRVSQLADEKMTISKLDWILLIARVRALEQVIAHESSRPVSLVGMHYDREQKVIVAKAFVDPAWISSAKIDDVHKLLTEQGANYCTDGLAMAEAEAAEIQAASDVGKDCSVDFFTWTLDRAGQITTKSVATMHGSQLILK